VKDDQMQITLSNQSPRIPEKELPRIFEKFYRVTAADKTTGTGLGLSICKGIVEAHGGTISAANLPDCFQFCINLPLITPEVINMEKSHA
jgi:two-component system sensor histidine kinase KdpD